jgi:predicted flap endonuclease-1-like 5' DNA nuclease
MIGLIWEFYNAFARGKWIYTVPWLEYTKLFEMPPLGFLGFPFFALEAWSMYHVLASVGLAPAADGTWRPRRTSLTVTAVAAATIMAVVVALGMERRTVSSLTPRLDRVPGATPAEVEALRAAGYTSVFAVGAADAHTFTSDVAVPVERAQALRTAAQLTALRGIGTAHAAALAYQGIASVCSLAGAAPHPVFDAMHASRSRRHRPTAAEVRVWIGAARRGCPDWRTRPTGSTGNR